MVKAIIFDCFGVLATDSWHAYIDKYFAEDLQKRVEASSLMDLANEGKLNNNQFLKEVGKLAGLDGQTAAEELSGNKPNLRLFEFIDKLKPKYSIGMLSNVSVDLLDQIFTSDQLRKLDASVLSFELRANKPDPITYKTIAKKLDVKPNECIFVDDVQSYVEGAEKVGMYAIRYKNLEQTIADIKSLVPDMNN